jgi:hypothetical protein
VERDEKLLGLVDGTAEIPVPVKQQERTSAPMISRSPAAAALRDTSSEYPTRGTMTAPSTTAPARMICAATSLVSKSNGSVIDTPPSSLQWFPAARTVSDVVRLLRTRFPDVELALKNLRSVQQRQALVDGRRRSFRSRSWRPTKCSSPTDPVPDPSAAPVTLRTWSSRSG